MRGAIKWEKCLYYHQYPHFASKLQNMPELVTKFHLKFQETQVSNLIFRLCIRLNALLLLLLLLILTARYLRKWYAEFFPGRLSNINCETEKFFFIPSISFYCFPRTRKVDKSLFPLSACYIWGLHSLPLVQSNEIQSEDSTGNHIS